MILKRHFRLHMVDSSIQTAYVADQSRLTGIGIKNLIITGNLNFSVVNILSIILSFIFSFITIKFFLQYIQKFNLDIFVYYRIVLGVLLLTYAYL